MSKELTVYQHMSGSDACNYHRLLLPSRYCDADLRKEGIHVSMNNAPIMNKMFADAFIYHGISKEILAVSSKGMQWMLDGRKVVWSIDDDFRCIPSWNPVEMTEQMTDFARWGANYASQILCSTQPLADTMVGRTGRISVAPNLLELNLYDCSSRDCVSGNRPLIIMYAGSPTHLGDMEQIVEPVTEILTKYPNVGFTFMGGCHPEIRKRHLYNGVVEYPMVGLSEYWMTVRNLKPDIWLCPLVDCEFNQSKSNLKAIEGFAMGAAVIASDVLPYRETITNGEDGILVDPESPSSWTEAMSAVIEDLAFRNNLSNAGLERANSRYNWLSEDCRRPWMEFYRGLRSPG